MPHDPAYDQTRAVFYGDIDRRPSVIVRVANVDDVRRVITTARAEGYELAVRSGGHSVAGQNLFRLNQNIMPAPRADA